MTDPALNETDQVAFLGLVPPSTESGAPPLSSPDADWLLEHSIMCHWLNHSLNKDNWNTHNASVNPSTLGVSHQQNPGSASQALAGLQLHQPEQHQKRELSQTLQAHRGTGPDLCLQPSGDWQREHLSWTLEHM